MPRWWLWTLYATIVWGVIYTILFPAWPMVTRATPGPPRLLEPAQRRGRDRRRAGGERAARPAARRRGPRGGGAGPRAPALSPPPAARRSSATTARSATAPAPPAWSATIPNLLDDDWLWGGTAADIQATVTHGIRYDADPDTRFSQMPAFGDILKPEEIDGLVQYVLSLSGQAAGSGGGRGGEADLPRQLRLLPRRERHRRPRVRRPEPDRRHLALRRRRRGDPRHDREGALRDHAGLRRPPEPRPTSPRSRSTSTASAAASRRRAPPLPAGRCDWRNEDGG